jgi:hypothetical protein
MIVEQVDEVFFMNCICGIFLPVLDDSVLMTLNPYPTNVEYRVSS